MSTQQILSQSLYIVFGTCSLISNSFVVYVIVACKALHFNAYYLAAALSMLDVIGGVGFIATGAYRLDAILSNQSTVLFPPWTCIYAPSTMFMVFPFIGGSMMAVLIALDRLLAIAAPKFYFRLGNRYTASLVAYCLLYVSGVWAYFAFDTMVMVPQVPSVTRFCYGVHTEGVHAFDYYSQCVLVSGSGIIMIVALIILHTRRAQFSAQNQRNPNSPQAIAAARNAKAARLLGLILLNTFSMWVVPDVVATLIDSYGRGVGSVFVEYVPFLFMLQPVHGTTNLLIYFRKGSQFREAFMQRRNQVASFKSGGSGTRNA